MRQKIRYAVVGLGHIAQVAVLPAFKSARNSELTALVSGDHVKLKKLSRKYDIPFCFSYEDFDECLESGVIDAVYIALPNNMHQEYAEAAARKGIHVLCEKPMGVTVEECVSMMEEAAQNRIKLMVAYRLHFEKANLQAIEIARSGKLGELKIFNSSFSMQVTDKDNIRLKNEMGGGTLFDIGIYQINAARYLFGDEPIEGQAMTTLNLTDPRFAEVEDTASCLLRFPQGKIANFTCSFGAADSSWFELIGTKGSLCLDNAFDYALDMTLDVTVGDRTRSFEYKKRDQFAPELIYFSDCILENKDPEPSALEGLNDVKIINALYESAQSGESVLIENSRKRQRPSLKQEIRRPAHDKPQVIHVTPPHDD